MGVVTIVVRRAHGMNVRESGRVVADRSWTGDGEVISDARDMPVRQDAGQERVGACP